jgi:hypothetical protein
MDGSGFEMWSGERGQDPSSNKAVAIGAIRIDASIVISENPASIFFLCVWRSDLFDANYTDKQLNLEVRCPSAKLFRPAWLLNYGIGSLRLPSLQK